MSGSDVLNTLILLLANQEHIKITYTIEREALDERKALSSPS